MLKRVFGKKLGRSYTAKKALFRSLTRAIIISGEIKTTYAKAKAVSGFIENLVRIAKKGDVAARRRVYAILANDRKTTDKLFEIAKSFKDVSGGFLKVVNLPPRKGDMAQVVKIGWSRKIEEVKSEPGGKETKVSKVKKNEKPVKPKAKGKTVKSVIKKD